MQPSLIEQCISRTTKIISKDMNIVFKALENGSQPGVRGPPGGLVDCWCWVLRHF